MALSDILERIAADAAAEAGEIRAAAEADAELIRSRAAEHAADVTARIARDGASDAAREAQTIAAAARLTSRDEGLSAKGALIDRALEKLEAAVAGLPSSEYTAFLARQIVESARGDERVLVAAADREKLAGLKSAVTALAAKQGRTLALTYPGDPAPVAHGVVLAGERDSVDLSVAGIIGAQREQLTMRLASALFGTGGDD